jgi:Photosynthetic reaction centre cytochrome C subunit
MQRLLTALAALALLSSQTADLPVEQTQKNIKVLKGIPTSQLDPLMAFMSNSLGVSCAHCHDVTNFAADTKDPKGVARSMIVMTREINERNFEGEQAVTCNSCHRGSLRPPTVPLIANAFYNAPPPPPKPTLPPPAEVIARLEKSAPKFGDAHGTVTRFDGKSAPFTLHDGKVTTTLEYPPEADEAFAPIAVNHDRATVTRMETINGHSAYVVEQKREKLYVDAQTGALLRRHRETDTELGPLPDETDYEGKTVAWSRGDAKVTFRLE